MPLFKSLRDGLHSLFHKRQAEQDMDDEMRAYLEAAVDRNLQRGLSPEDALRRARVDMGSPEAVKQQIRSSFWEFTLETLLQDIRYGFRMLARTPRFTAVALLSLSLGIGANTAMFTLLKELAMKSLPIRDAKQLVFFGESVGGGSVDGIGPGPLDLFPYDFYTHLDQANSPFSGICAVGSFRPAVSVRRTDLPDASPSQAIGHLVSGNYFDIMGVDPHLGRFIRASDDNLDHPVPVAVISDDYWQRLFARSPDAIGATLIVNRTPFTVVGVTPPGFYGEAIEARTPDLWFPLAFQPQITVRPTLLGPRALYWLHLMGRIPPGTAPAQARAWTDLNLHRYMLAREGAAVTKERAAEIQRVFVDIVPGIHGVSGLRARFQQPLYLLFAIVFVVLLIACANLAGFVLARSAAREREVSTRLAIGAGRWRIIRQMLTESLLLSFLGGTLGIFVAWWATRALVAFLTDGALNAPINARPDFAVLAFTSAASVLAGLLFGIGPALRVSRVSFAPGTQGSGRRVAGHLSPAGGWPSRLLVVSQVALSLVLLASAGLFIASLRDLYRQDLGFNPRHLLLGAVNAPIAGYDPARVLALNQTLLTNLAAIPGVQSVALSGSPPLSHGSWDSPFHIAGRVPAPGENIDTFLNRVSPAYFATLEIPVIEGRAPNDHDSELSQHVVVVNRDLADHFFPGHQAVGRHVTFDEPDLPGDWEIVGVVGNAKYNNPGERQRRMTYLPAAQMSGTARYTFALQIRTAAAPENLIEPVRRAVARIDPNLPLEDTMTASQLLDRFLDLPSLVTNVSGFFAGLALLLACIGIYGLMMFNVLRRTNEIGIRIALGARPRRVLWMVLQESVVLLAAGMLIGLPAAVLATRFIKSQTPGIDAPAPLTFLAPALLLSAVTLLAGYLPARRATQVDPMVALRYE